jgi:hypothetical protein
MFVLFSPHVLWFPSFHILIFSYFLEFLGFCASFDKLIFAWVSSYFLINVLELFTGDILIQSLKYKLHDPAFLLQDVVSTEKHV